MAAPTITQEDLSSFHAAHFTSFSTEHFATHFLGPVEEEYVEEDIEDDGLGYYPDGVKRTLTDEQIAIFRHSEIEAIARERRHAREAITTLPSANDADLEDGELADHTATPSTDNSTPPPQRNGPGNNGKPKTKKDRKKEKARQKGWFKEHVKPDLRKRTWDKVDTGLGSLDYDETEQRAIGPVRPSQRKKVCYDDD